MAGPFALSDRIQCYVPAVARFAGHLFTIALGFTGWAVVLGLPALGVLPKPTPTPALWIALFIAVILAARALAFRMASGSVLSLDSAFYVAATLCVGSVGAGRIVAVALTVTSPGNWASRVAVLPSYSISAAG